MLLKCCNKCNWFHFPISREQAMKDAKSFELYINAQSDEVKKSFGLGKLSQDGKEYSIDDAIKRQEKCFKCGNNYKDFRDEDENKCPIGVTIQGIISE
jgi:hypothetical protein